MRRFLQIAAGWFLASQAVFATAPARADRPAGVTAQTVSLPSGATSLKGLGESFEPNISSGTGSYSVGIDLPPGFVQPSVSLGYSGGSGKGEIGMGWSLPILHVYRSTDKGAPEFDEDDRFAVAGPGINDELVRVNTEEGLYRLKNEGSFVLFERQASSDSWVVHFPSGERAFLGEDGASRQTSLGRPYKWFITRQADRFGHTTRYTYLRDAGRVYLDHVDYNQHAPERHHNRVKFHYETRPDTYTDYHYGDECSTQLRLAQVTVHHGDRELRSYDLEYSNGLLFSLLRSVHMRGEGGELAMPTLRFTYLADSRESGELVSMEQLPNLEGLSDGLAEFDDVNGDGLPDLVYGVANNYHYFANLDGRRFRQAPFKLQNSPDRHLFEPGVLFADLNADGFRDLVHPQGERFRYYPAGPIENGVFRGFEDAVELDTQAGGFHFGDRQVKLSDLNSDGRIDLLWQKPGQDTVLLNINDELVEQPIEELPVDVDFGDSRVMFADFNGDGELDLVRSGLDFASARVHVWFGLGKGRYTTRRSMRNVPPGDASEFFFEDVNRDGQTDLVRVSGSWATYYLNDGDLGYTGKRGDYYGLPGASTTRKVMFADMNGNGSRDLIWYTTGDELVYLDLMGEPNAGLLSRIDNGMGAVTTMSYRSSTEFAIEARESGRPWKHPLRSPVPVLKEIRTTDSFDSLGFEATETRTTFVYRDGYYDGKEREFRGFAWVEATDHGDEHHETLITETHMHVGRNPLTGADEEILKGKPYLLLQRNEQGLLATTETSWDLRWMCQEDLVGVSRQVLPSCSRFANLDEAKDELVAYAEQPLVLQGVWENTGEPRFTATGVEYDAWGSPVRTSTFGEVAFAGWHEPGDAFHRGMLDVHVGDDETITESRTIYDVDEWLIGLPSFEEKRDIAGRLVSRRRTRYDGDQPYQGLAPGQATHGLPTQEQAWFAEESRWVDVKRTQYSDAGKPTSVLDANGNEVQFEYDITDTFVTVESTLLEGGPARFTGTYDQAYGNLVTSTDANGLTTRVWYDALGRVSRIAGPEDSFERPRVRHRYAYGTSESPVSVTTTDTLVSREGEGTYRRSFTYADGAGVVRQTKVEAESGSGYIVEGWVDKTSRGAAARKYQVFQSDFAGLELPPSTVPSFEGYFDALGRPTHMYSPATENIPRTYVHTMYLPMETRVYGEKDTTEGHWRHPVISRMDGQGRVREVEKTYTQGEDLRRLVWRHDFDAAGRITSIADPKWSPDASDPNHSDRHLRHYAYDSLGRQTWLRDPNMGLVEFAYDDAGNLLSRTDALGQSVEWEYGLANRPRLRRATGQADGEPDAEYRYHYDAPDPSGPLPDADHLLGRLAWVEYPTGADYFAYDVYGRDTETARVLWNPVLSNFGDQSRDVFHSEVATYTADDLPLEVEAPGGLQLEYSYNERRMLDTLRATFGGQSHAVFSGLKYNARGQLQSGDLGNGTRTCRTYDRRAQLTGSFTAKIDEATCGSSAPIGVGVQNVRYQRGYEGRLTSIDDHSAVLGQPHRMDAAYRYDELGQLVFASNSEATMRFEYDEIQNLVARDLLAGTPAVPTGQFDYGEDGAGPSMLTSAGEESYTYDAAGQLERINGYDLTFDAEGQLSAARASGKDVRFHYDAWGKRAIAIASQQGGSTRVRRYIGSGYEVRDLVLATGEVETDELWLVGTGLGSAEIRRAAGVDVDAFLLNQLSAYADGAARQLRPLPVEYMDLDGDGDSLDEGDVEAATAAFVAGRKAGGVRDVWTYHHTDQLGGTTHITDSEGELVTFQSFHAYGAPSGRSGMASSRGFGGAAESIDADLGLVHYGARYYAPKLGRWISPDRYIGDSPMQMAATPLESSLFNYAANNPIGRSDPSGQMSKAEGLEHARRGAMKVIDSAMEQLTLQGLGKAAIAAARDALISALLGPAGLIYKLAQSGKAIYDNLDQLKEAANNLSEQVGGLWSWGNHLVFGEWTAADYEAVGAAATVVALSVTASLVSKAVLKPLMKGLQNGLKKLKLGKPRRTSGCSSFVAGTLVTLAVATGQAQLPIEDVEVGQRVLPGDPECEQLDVHDWVRVDVLMRGSDDHPEDVYKVSLLRPIEWVTTNGAIEGREVYLEFDELNLDGWALVLRVRDGPGDVGGPGCPVIATIEHTGHDFVELGITDGEPLVLTATHRLYSATRGDWVEAWRLIDGEVLVTEAGVTTVIWVDHGGRAAEPVYNLEVAGVHRYYAGDAAVLAHNECPAGLVKDGKIDHRELMDWKDGKSDWNPSKPGDQWTPSDKFPSGGFRYDLKGPNGERYKVHGHGRNPSPNIPADSNAARGPTTTIRRSHNGKGEILTQSGQWKDPGQATPNEVHIPLSGSPF